ncbi:MAG: hypothetical protein M0Z62_09260, partial [Actinomycetota bacterium]|nr:hypothetical protein [Actinomycetota bacterium]
MAVAATAVIAAGIVAARPSGPAGHRPPPGRGVAAGLQWSPPRTVDAAPPFGPSNHLTALACPATTMCVAGDAGGRVLVTSEPTGGAASWTAEPVDPGGSITALACPTPTMCVAGDAGGRVLVTTDPTGGAASWTAAPVDRP